MKDLLNHTDLAVLIKNNDMSHANNVYKKKVMILLSSPNNQKKLKTLLYSINMFLFTYFSVTDSISLEDLCYKNISIIDSYNSQNDLISFGEEMIKNYKEAISSDQCIPENEIIKEALSYIHSNIEKKITLEKVAAHIHISNNYLCYLFKENTGFKFCEYINICRINVAKEFLTNSCNSIDVISCKCGFNSQSHFCTTFKKYVGVSPNVYRKRV